MVVRPSLHWGMGQVQRWKGFSEEHIACICSWKWEHCHLRVPKVWDSAQEPIPGEASNLSGTTVTYRTTYCTSLLRRILALKEKSWSPGNHLPRIGWRSIQTQKEPHPRSLLPYWHLWLGLRTLLKKPPRTVTHLHGDRQKAPTTLPFMILEAKYYFSHRLRSIWHICLVN